MHYLIDIDGVCADFANALIDAIKPAVSKEDMIEWDILDAYFTAEERRRATQLLAQSEFWANLPVVDGAKDAISHLRLIGHTFEWVTSPWISCADFESARTSWIEQMFGGGERIQFRADKEKVDGDRLIDDKPDNVEKWQKAHRKGKAFLFRTQFNQGFNWPYIMENGWQDLGKIL